MCATQAARSPSWSASGERRDFLSLGRGDFLCQQGLWAGLPLPPSGQGFRFLMAGLPAGLGL